MNKQYKFHMLGLVHLPASRTYMSCAFTQKNYKLAQMLLSLGHEVFYYGCEGSTIPCTEFIQTHTLADVCKEWGDGDNRFEIGYNWTDTDFRHDFSTEKTKTTQKYYANCIDHIKSIQNPDDFVLVTQGYYQKPITDSLDLYLKVEPGIGYRGSFLPFRAFESSYIQNFTYGSSHPYECIDGSYYDRVIPNYFDPNDFEFSDTKEDYCLFIGRMIKRKGIMTAYLACKEAGIHLKIVGQGGKILPDGSLTATTHADFLMPPGDWEYVGYADVDKRKGLMAKARATFTATEYLECFAGTHVESMLSGTPVITTNFAVFPGTIPDIFDGNSPAKHMYSNDFTKVVGFKCNTLSDFVSAVKNATKVDPSFIRKYSERFLMDNVKWEYQKWFDDLYQLYLSASQPDTKGWSYLP